MKTLPTLVRAADLAAYAPANHTGTSNVRVICPETVGATALEVLIGTIVKSHGAKPHAHPHLEQCAYMIEGTAESQAQGRVEALTPGSWSYVPAGAFHSFRVTSEQPGRVLVVYAPPYGENPAQTITEPDPAVSARGKVRVLAAGDAIAATGALIDRDTVGAQWVEIEPLRMAEGSALSCAPRPDAEQVLYLEDGHIDARAGEMDFHLAPGDFLFLPCGAGVALRCPTGRRASGFFIKGRLPSSHSH
ncbi:cupin domain-containing protein [Variovorax sp. J22R133]|uniref:cupin domain-containing protein n=1 Tax=Variovorax brevis TaxID=3053503 RepID=UPI002577DD41|nr:cupin domain-containing protein [Variovorax sp. J22R133]MDM0116654.1 cupin domain-containing protein [Variovorax sp. J22R133]